MVEGAVLSQVVCFPLEPKAVCCQGSFVFRGSSYCPLTDCEGRGGGRAEQVDSQIVYYEGRLAHCGEMHPLISHQGFVFVSDSD